MLTEGKMVVWILALIIPAFILFNVLVPDPYMDEIFHVPQAQQYCKGNFSSWDPQITTLPGLYILSYLYVGVLYAIALVYDHRLTLQDLCSTPVLRFLNVILAVKCAYLFREVAHAVDPKAGIQRSMFKGLVLAAFPLQWFFSLMYYTDIASTAAVMAMYLMVVSKRHWLAALFAVEAILVRQTNLVWVVFGVCTGVMLILSNPPPCKRKKKEEERLLHVKETLATGKKGVQDLKLPAVPSAKSEGSVRKRSTDHTGVDKHDDQQEGRTIGGAVTKEERMEEEWRWRLRRLEPNLIKSLAMLIFDTWDRLGEVLWNVGPLLLVLMGFAAFFVWNGGIVVGAHEAHKMSLHLAQILYFGAFSVFMLAPIHFNTQNIMGLWQAGVQHLQRPIKAALCSILAVTAAFMCVHWGSIAHPYLLSDNRHYPFYIWRWFITRTSSTKYIFIPIYLLAWTSIFVGLGQRQNRLWIFFYFSATVAVLTPSPLIELRYFIIPFLFQALHTPMITKKRLPTLPYTFVQYILVDIIAASLFLFRPFSWVQEPGVLQRFMW